MQLTKRKINPLKIDAGAMLLIALLLILINYVCLGFAKNGLSAPLSYNNGDSFYAAQIIKSIAEEGWVHENTRIGAPYGMTTYDFPIYFLMNTENTITFIITRFIKDPYLAFNIQFLLSFALFGTISFFVLRNLGIRRIIAAAGALIYGTAPYIYCRGMHHYTLTACYFIPLSILLCVWAYEADEQYMSIFPGLKRFFAYGKNRAAIVICLLIANNGIGYYPFFTCFFLCITALMTAIKTRKISSIRTAILPLMLIVFFMFTALLPVFIHIISEGKNDIARRGLVELEFYGLKATQFFIPTNNNHPAFIRNLVSQYNTKAILINENTSTYLGIFGCIGFIAMMILSLFPLKKQEEHTLSLFSKLTIWALLFFHIGGFITLFCLITGFRSLRAFCRVSIFIDFMAVATLCILIQKLLALDSIQKKKHLLYACRILILVFSLFCLWEQHPSIHENETIRAEAKLARQNDIVFMQQIESQLKKDDMVFQLPYMEFPEGGSIGKMGEYAHFIGYLNSSQLRWSYGSMKGRASDKWNAETAALPMQELIPAIVHAGFRGIYIDSNAYNSNELQQMCSEIECILQKHNAVKNADNRLIFYSLYPYITAVEQNAL